MDSKSMTERIVSSEQTDSTEQLDSTKQMDATHPLTQAPSDIEDGPPAEQSSTTGLSTGRTVLLISSLNATVLVAAMNTGMLTVNLPHMGDDLHISRSLLLWPALVYSLTQGIAILPSGAAADILGNRTINLTGTAFLGLAILAAGLARSGAALIAFRAAQGVAVAMCFPTAVGILSSAFPSGKVRNIAFGCLGLGTPLGFAAGILVGGGFETGGVGWRAGFYVVAGVTMGLFGVNCWALPREEREGKGMWKRLRAEVDWMGVCLSSFSMALLSYSLALMSGNPESLRDPSRLLLLVIALGTIPLFVVWMHVQAGRGKPALIPNSLWKNATFSAICMMVLLSWATLQSLEWFISLFYQQVQHLTAIETSVRYMPNIIAGSTLNVVTGLIVHRIRINYYVVIISGLCALSPLLMAITKPEWSWWYTGFWVMLLLPISVDVNFTIANLIITDIFPAETQALAGAVYQAVAQLGISLGIAILAVISNRVTDKAIAAAAEHAKGPAPSPAASSDPSPTALLAGFRAVFWTCFGMMVLSTAVGAWGLRGRRGIGARAERRKEDRGSGGGGGGGKGGSSLLLTLREALRLGDEDASRADVPGASR